MLPIQNLLVSSSLFPVSKIYSGLLSLWMTPISWQYFTTDMRSLITNVACNSEKVDISGHLVQQAAAVAELHDEVELADVLKDGLERDVARVARRCCMPA